MKKVTNIIWQAKLEKKRNWLKATKLLQDGIREFPTEISLYQELADIYYAKRLIRKAISIYQKALSFKQDEDFILMRIGNCFLSLNEYRIALDYYKNIKDETPELLYNRAFAYSKINRIDDSIEILKKVITLKLTSEIPFVFLAELYFTKKQFETAIGYLNKAENIFGKQGTFHYLKGLAYSNQKNWLKAFVEFQKAEKLKANSSHFYRLYGIASEKIGRTSQAIDNLLSSIKISPTDPANYIELIKIYLAHDRIQEAYRIIRSSQKSVPLSFSLSLLHQQILSRLEQRNYKF
ncbi:MAG TPA: hypothetical protein ENL20_07280 [Candidatus Cloacimonetes bacterium]|nr:hypothetical protein [Candidatus Cloacimonadota bacterium]